MGYAFITHRFIKLAKLKPKFRPFKTGENEQNTHKIAAIVFCSVFLCLFRRFKAHESDVFEIRVGLAVLDQGMKSTFWSVVTREGGGGEGACMCQAI